jgi:hypothetical protein
MAHTRSFLFALLAALGFAPPIQAGQVSIAWDPNPEPDVIEYRVYYGESLNSPLTVGSPTNSVTISNLADGREYFFAVTAVSAAGLESEQSEAIRHRIPSIEEDGTLSTPPVEPVPEHGDDDQSDTLPLDPPTLDPLECDAPETEEGSEIEEAIEDELSIDQTPVEKTEIPPTLKALQAPQSIISLALTGEPARIYDVQACSVLGTEQWETIARGIADKHGKIVFTDSQRERKRFYRAALSEG